MRLKAECPVNGCGTWLQFDEESIAHIMKHTLWGVATTEYRKELRAKGIDTSQFVSKSLATRIVEQTLEYRGNPVETTQITEAPLQDLTESDRSI